MLTVNESEIEDEVLVCPYCMGEVSSDVLGCCGESSTHFEIAYILTNGEIYLDSEIVIIKEVSNEK